MAKFIYFFLKYEGVFASLNSKSALLRTYSGFFGLELRLNQPDESSGTPTAFVVVKIAPESLPITITVNVALTRKAKKSKFSGLTHLEFTWSYVEHLRKRWALLTFSLQLSAG